MGRLAVGWLRATGGVKRRRRCPEKIVEGAVQKVLGLMNTVGGLRGRISRGPKTSDQSSLTNDMRVIILTDGGGGGLSTL